MKFGSSFLLLGGIILLAALPACADSIYYITSTNEPSSPECIASTYRTSHAKFITPATAQLIQMSLPTNALPSAFAVPASVIVENSTLTESSRNQDRTFDFALADPQNSARSSGPAPATLATNSFQPSGYFSFSSSESSLVLGTLVPTEPKPSAHSGDPVEFNSTEPGSAEFSAAGSRLGFFGNDPDHDRGGKGKKKDLNGPPVNLSEPAALPLLTLGLLAVGIMSRRNRDLTTNA
jgi:hypothetical protein